MFIGILARQAAHAAITGVVGVAIVNAVKGSGGRNVVKKAAVGVAELGLRSARVAEAGAENVRLAAADVMAEAKQRVGGEVKAPGVHTGNDHQH
ncbi:DUF1490 family protein [Nakamurella antarctica]|uniref:DUF1490 family protein n=2 Tax=Nakamurella antarctica TaxID=1902245 RepID=A0A3G8ZNQ4_9ACTN|nr:DUF1490 family protein [Nakamurella antarctica]